MDRVAIFPGSFDPFTRGHAQIVEQALSLFDRVVVGVGNNSQKSGLLELDERRRLIDDYYCDNDRVSVAIYNSLTVEFAKEVGAVAMIRGIRSTLDFEYERALCGVNHRLQPEVVTVVLFPHSELADVSSSVVRELYNYGHSVNEFLPEGIDIRKYIR